LFVVLTKISLVVRVVDVFREAVDANC